MNQQSKVKGVVDIVFLLDATGSMSECIDGLKENIQAFITSLTAKDANNASPVREWRAKVVGYRDFAVDGDEKFEDNPFVTTTEELRGQLTRLEAKGGGDEAESLLEALYKVASMPATEQNEAPQPERWRYRSDAHRAVIGFSDASFSRTLVEPTGATLDDVITLLENSRILLNLFAPELPHYSELAELDKCVFKRVDKEGCSPQEALKLFTQDSKNFQETLQKLGRTLSATVAATPLQ